MLMLIEICGIMSEIEVLRINNREIITKRKKRSQKLILHQW